ncbi:Endocytosis and vacuole integrity protein, partial [Linderina macrospora]
MDIQVKILQMILPLVSAYDTVSGETLVEAIHICFVLQQSRDPIVNNTAAAILRQLVVAVFDRVVGEDKETNSTQVDAEADLTRKCAKDAYYVLQDLCLLLTDSETVFIRADTIDKGLVLELIESILTNHARVVARHAAMAQLLRDRLSPYIVHFFAEKSTFPLAVRCTRIVWLFIRDLHAEFSTECEIFLSTLTRLMDPSTSSGSRNAAAPGRRRPSFVLPGGVGAGNPSTLFPPFYRVLALEVVKKTVEDSNLLQELYTQFDGRASSDDDCHVILDIITAVGKVVSERPTIRSSNSDGIPSALPEGGTASTDTQLRRLATDADANSEKDQISARSCRMRSEMHKLLDKQDAPTFPDTYLFYLALSSIISLVDGLASAILPSRTASLTASINGKEVTKGVLALPDSSDQSTQVISGLASKIWPILLTAYSFFLNVRFDNSLFNQVMESSQKLVLVLGALDIRDARDAVLSLLCRHCLPHAAISEHERQLQQSQATKSRSLATVPEDESKEADSRAPVAAPLVTSSLIGAQFSMHSRQIQCLRTVVACAQFLAGALGPAWYPIMVTLQQADELLYQSRGSLPSSTTATANGNASHGQTPTRNMGGRQRSMSTASTQAPSSSDELSRATEFQAVREEYVQLFALVRAHGSDAFIW